MYVVDGLKLHHGLAVISREQTHGQGTYGYYHYFFILEILILVTFKGIKSNLKIDNFKNVFFATLSK